jgi:DNA-binding response OmpR family regulator
MKDGLTSYSSNNQEIIARSTEEQAKRAYPVTGKVSKGTILIVDDESLLLQLLKQMFEAEGFKVLTASNSVDALMLFQKHKSSIEVVISDLGLPNISGWELINLMKVVKYDLKSVIMTSFIEHYSRTEVFSPALVSDVFIKPFDPYDLIDKVKVLLAA